MQIFYNYYGDIMKVLSIKEPYASLIMMNIKKIETRSFKTKYRGELYIHASLSKSNQNDELSKLVSPMYGEIICKCSLVDCVLMTEEFIENLKKEKPVEYKCGHYEVGRYAWILEDVKIIESFKAKGKLGIWNYYEKNKEKYHRNNPDKYINKYDVTYEGRR